MKHGRLALLIVVALIVMLDLLLASDNTRAVQSPRISLDMDPTGNTYDDTTNTMTVGPIDSCLTGTPGNAAQHNHVVHLVIQNVEDLIGWQVRLVYDGGRMRPAGVNFSPFVDNTTGQNISFTNLPIDSVTRVHRDLVSATDMPPAAAGPQTALVGASYAGEETAAMSPDTPPKSPPDDTSYSAPTGGILAAVNLQVQAGQVGADLLTMDLSADTPHPPGSKVVIFSGRGPPQDLNLTEDALGDGFHGEGALCVPPPPGATPQSTGEATPELTPASGTPASPATGGGTATSSPEATNVQAAGAKNAEDGGGIPVWIIVAIAVGLPLSGGAGVAAWRLWRRREGAKG